ncbi:holin [Lactococcus garvieae]|uniref:hemolysin XhlA family protein n=1 Tax=Lactococcus TaxID=1357 RepID=UPI0013FDB04A|nr:MULTISPECIES: hemolysin XhlA family protein [Lactococcus]MDN5628842.1 hemolysin XhlA family protein [Lactococcus sp.]MDG6130849.1 hemolysin XhlA family protein [Lactococcus formosensis]MDN5628850.1 hemolysin XhlA family protein [Lactococcus sp.]NHI73569.1 holin [Lactococcus garvieae]UHU65059.1 holin [Lactococcus garvieae]
MEEQAVREILERTTRIETKLDNYESVRDKADKAYSLAINNAKDIAKIEANNKWAWGFMITIAISFVGYLLSKI